MTHEHIGELAALATAVLWTLSAVAWTSAGKRIGALAVSFLRLLLAVGLLMAYGYFRRGLAWPSDADPASGRCWASRASWGSSSRTSACSRRSWSSARGSRCW